MSSAKWIPNDAELDELARELPAAEPSPESAEQNRTRMLAAASNAARLPRRSRVPLVVASAALAAAAAVAVWIALPSHKTPPAKQAIVAIGDARFERDHDWPDYRLRVHDGTLAITVSHLEASDRFRVLAVDTELDVRSATFQVAAKQDRVESLLVESGSVDVKHGSEPVVTVLAGSRWSPPVRTAKIDKVDIEPAPPAPTTPPRSEPVVATDGPEPKRKPKPAVTTTTPPPPPPKAEPPPQPQPQPQPQPAPGEAEFRKGWASLRGGDANAAMTSFATACTQLQRESLGEDACYWHGVAAKRAGNARVARGALSKFLAKWPSSSRAGEASALLGWLHYEANDLDGAHRAFERAARDRSASVRESAEKGLTAVERKRKAP